MTVETPYAPGQLEREVVLARVIDAPRALVYRAWVEPGAMFEWFGPDGFRCVVHEQVEARPGAVWRFDMIAPNGHVFDNRMTFLEVVPDERLVFAHGTDVDDDPQGFVTTITFDAQGDEKTVLTLRQYHPSKARRDTVIGFGAVELGYQTLGKLAAYLARR